ncbi:amidohydrolase family protein [Paraburkholderia sp. BL23I1N1]|uniref:amidohydrolase family protein n=1 Tax=Paraburkholderia sp. BL23I1N1 TaxID=1938802 RepID=UPI001602C6B5|nr:amidohydrolase family protein [Paraburkholderia sp. BL23I1N1]
MTSSNIVDVHSHALLPIWRKAAARAQGRGDDTPEILGRPAPPWSEAAHLAVMDAHGITMSVLSWPSAAEGIPSAEAASLVRGMNEALAEIVSRQPTRFGAFASLPLGDPDALAAESVYALDVLGLDGISCTPQMQGYYLGEARYDDWFAELDRRGAVLFVHPSAPPGQDALHSVVHPAILEFMFDTTRAVANLVFTGARRRFPNIRIVCAHGGGVTPYLAHRMGLLGPARATLYGGESLSRDEILHDLSSFDFDLTASTSHVQLQALCELVGSARLMFGFDFPMMATSSIAPALQALRDTHIFTADEKMAIASGNALRLLPKAARRLSTGS